jgi:hypothetical protein
MDDSVGKDITWFFAQFWSSLVVALVIYVGGVTAARIVKAIWPQTSDLVDEKTKVTDPKLPFLFRLWYTTRLSHPFIVGVLISFVPELPHPEFVSSHTSGALWFGFCGLANGQIHMLVEAMTGQFRKAVDLFVPWLRQKLGLPSATLAPAAPATDPMPSADDTSIPKDDEKP